MSKMFFNNSTYDFFKKEARDPAYLEKRKKKVSAKKPPIAAKPMKTAKERLVKNRDGTITMLKQDKGGFTQTINIYTGRQRATGIKAKGQNTVRKEEPKLFTPSGRPDFKKWELYLSSFNNQLIDDRLKRLKANTIDLDYLDEQIRLNTGYVSDNELIISLED